MSRWIVTYDDAIADADTATEAVELRIDEDSIPIGATVFAIRLDEIEGTEACVRMRVGAHPVVEAAE